MWAVETWSKSRGLTRAVEGGYQALEAPLQRTHPRYLVLLCASKTLHAMAEAVEDHLDLGAAAGEPQLVAVCSTPCHDRRILQAAGVQHEQPRPRLVMERLAHPRLEHLAVVEPRRQLGVLSYGWGTRDEPDPSGKRIPTSPLIPATYKP